MANDKKVLLRHFKLLAVRCIATVTSKISELTNATSEALTELDDAKQDVIDGIAINANGIEATDKTIKAVDADGSNYTLINESGFMQATGSNIVSIMDSKIQFVGPTPGMISGLDTPTEDDHAVNKAYVDGIVETLGGDTGTARDGILITDRLTGTIYTLYVADGKLMME